VEELGVRVVAVSVEPPEVSARFRKGLASRFTFLSDTKGELLSRLALLHRRGYAGRDVAIPAAILVDKHGIVRWVYRSELGHLRVTPEDVFAALERLTLEEQNLELRRGKAVGRVVKRVYLMKEPEDLAAAIEALRDELRKLGVTFSVCGVAIVDEPGGSLRMISARHERLSSMELRIEDYPETAEMLEFWTKRAVGIVDLTDGAARFRDVALSAACEGCFTADLEYLLNVPFSHGTLFIGGTREQHPKLDDVATLTEFADAISVAYQRFVDFRNLENRTRELQETQIQLIQSEKMAALGQLVAGVAHELNTPMGAIHSNTQSARKALERLTDGSVSEHASTLEQLLDMNQVNDAASRRIIEIVSNLRRFARLDESEWKKADLRSGLDETLALVAHQTRGRIEVVRSYGEVPLVGCYPGQLNQVFMNLIVNAIQAIDGEGRIDVECHREGNAVVVRVRDTGHGIREEALSRIFDPGYTTKGVGVGTGLGLSIAYRIASNHGGSLRVKSEVGKGSEFTLTIPADLPPPRTLTTSSAYTRSFEPLRNSSVPATEGAPESR
jgi:signal transduction histidine kinase